LKLPSRFVRMFIVLILILISSCTSAEDRLKTEFDALPQANSILLYEYGSVSSGATGDCIGTFLHRWYGSAMRVEEVVKLYEDNLANAGWTFTPDEVGEFWSKENKQGLYQVNLNIFTAPETISQEQGLYKLPNSVLLETVKYQVIYLISMTYLYPSAAKKCFGR